MKYNFDEVKVKQKTSPKIKKSRTYNRPISSQPSDEESVGVGGSEVVVLVTLNAGDIIWGPQQPDVNVSAGTM